jgi:hypothetical protein
VGLWITGSFVNASGEADAIALLPDQGGSHNPWHAGLTLKDGATDSYIGSSGAGISLWAPYNVPSAHNTTYGSPSQNLRFVTHWPGDAGTWWVDLLGSEDGNLVLRSTKGIGSCGTPCRAVMMTIENAGAGNAVVGYAANLSNDSEYDRRAFRRRSAAWRRARITISAWSTKRRDLQRRTLSSQKRSAA